MVWYGILLTPSVTPSLHQVFRVSYSTRYRCVQDKTTCQMSYIMYSILEQQVLRSTPSSTYYIVLQEDRYTQHSILYAYSIATTSSFTLSNECTECRRSSTSTRDTSPQGTASGRDHDSISRAYAAQRVWVGRGGRGHHGTGGLSDGTRHQIPVEAGYKRGVAEASLWWWVDLCPQISLRSVRAGGGPSAMRSNVQVLILVLIAYLEDSHTEQHAVLLCMRWMYLPLVLMHTEEHMVLLCLWCSSTYLRILGHTAQHRVIV